MPKVSSCTVLDCGYNKDNACHAPTIEVGSVLPCCDTYSNLPSESSFEAITEVEKCKVERCMYNNNLECAAENIEIARKSCNADCLMFKEKLLLAANNDDNMVQTKRR